MYKGRLVFATNNPHKLEEARHILSGNIQVLSLRDIGCNDELPETHETLEENAMEKARFVYERYRVNCFAEDTGLEVASLGGQPGVYSARFAGPGKKDNDNISLLLAKLNGIENRAAQFRAVIGIILNGREFLFEGAVKGSILEKPSGNKGFGYDPVFLPDGSQQSFAEMSLSEKSGISHRKKALEKLVDFLRAVKTGPVRRLF